MSELVRVEHGAPDEVDDGVVEHGGGDAGISAASSIGDVMAVVVDALAGEVRIGFKKKGRPTAGVSAARVRGGDGERGFPCSGVGVRTMRKPYIAISVIIFALVAIGHLIRIVQGWQVQLGDMSVAMSVSWIALVVSAALAVWGATLLRR
jgi:hypothetical protein